MSGFLLCLVVVILGAVVEGKLPFRRDLGNPGGPLGDILCKSASVHVRNIPHPYDCSKYFSCDTSANTSTIYSCKEPLYFNAKTQICDLKERAGCGGTTTKPTTQATTTVNNDDYNRVCAKATAEIWHLPFPGDCTKFIKCDIVGKIYRIYTCESPLHFNPSIQTCDRPENVDCGQGNTGNGNKTDYDRVCGKATPEVWHLPFPGDCTKFIKCDIVGKKYKVYTCDDPLHFNPSIQTCDWPWAAGCTNVSVPSTPITFPSSPTTTPTTTTPTTTTPTTTTPTTTPVSLCSSTPETTTKKGCQTTPRDTSCEDDKHKEDCNCDSSSSSSSEECNPTTTTRVTECSNSGDKTPTPSATPPTGNKCPSPFGPNDVCRVATLPDYWHIADPTDRTRFYKCEIQSCRAFLFNCPSGLVFNQAIQVCDWP